MKQPFSASMLYNLVQRPKRVALDLFGGLPRAELVRAAPFRREPEPEGEVVLEAPKGMVLAIEKTEGDWRCIVFRDPLSDQLSRAWVTPPSVAELIASGETGTVEFKSTLRTNLHTGQADEKIHLSVLKTIAAFLNAKGGTLLIGVADDGQVLGLGADGFSNEDKMGLHLVNLIKDRIGEVFMPYVHPHFEEQDGTKILSVRCERGPKPAFVKDGGAQRFFVRGGNATTELSGGSVTDYVKHRF